MAMEQWTKRHQDIHHNSLDTITLQAKSIAANQTTYDHWTLPLSTFCRGTPVWSFEAPLFVTIDNLKVVNGLLLFILQGSRLVLNELQLSVKKTFLHSPSKCTDHIVISRLIYCIVNQRVHRYEHQNHALCNSTSTTRVGC